MLLNLFRRFQRQRNFLTLAQAQFIRDRIASTDAKEDARIAFERMDDGQAVHALTELHRRRKGMTLIELLIVVAILLILVAAATTMMNVAIDGAEVREAARQVNALFAGCVARAMETGRGTGVWLERQDSNPNASLTMKLCQYPPMYAGDFDSTTATITKAVHPLPPGIDYTVTFDIQTRPPFGPDGAANTADDFFVSGDRVRFDYKGCWYDITSTTSNAVVIYIADTSTQPHPLEGKWRYQIQRGPKPTLGSPLQLPGATCVDLSRSGYGNAGAEFAVGTRPVAVMFDRAGSVDAVFADYDGTWQRYSVVEQLHFLIGSPVNIGTANIDDMKNRWISITPSTSTVITTENMGVSADRDGSGSIDYADARVFAVQGKGMGGN